MASTELVEVPPNKEELIRSLYAMGQDPYKIASIVREDIVYVRRILSKYSRRTEFTHFEDKELADAMRTLAWRALEEALEVFENGHPVERLALTKTIIGRTASMVGSQTTTHYDDMRNELEEIFTGVRGTEEPLTIPEELEVDIDEPESRSEVADIDIDDYDEGSNY